ncbi:hypothetical protein [Pectobacterium aroidearum]|uniref:hypothetical protein n=1 Tax=Pectobacterium aroidearum TaxID=1201031 RepID=UPI00301A9306
MTELTIEQLKEENEYLRKRYQQVDLFFGKMILVMQASCIESEHGGGDKQAMQWIINTLDGPGEFAPEDEKDAQAYFDREMVKVDEGLSNLYDYFSARAKKFRAEGIKR